MTAIAQILFYSALIFCIAFAAQPSQKKPEIWYMTEGKPIKKEKNYG